jgi:hypothetical protein
MTETPWSPSSDIESGLIRGGDADPLCVCLEHHVLQQVAGKLAVAGQHDRVPQQPTEFGHRELLVLDRSERTGVGDAAAGDDGTHVADRPYVYGWIAVDDEQVGVQPGP